MIPPNKDNEPRLDYQSAYLYCPICDGEISPGGRTPIGNQYCPNCNSYREYYEGEAKGDDERGCCAFIVVVGNEKSAQEKFVFDGYEPDWLAEKAYAAVARVRQEHQKKLT